MQETNTSLFSINVKMTRQSKRWRSPWRLWRWQKSSCTSWFRFQFCATKTYQIFFTKFCAIFGSFWLAVDEDKCDVEDDDQDHDDCNVAVEGDGVNEKALKILKRGQENIEDIEMRSRSREMPMLSRGGCFCCGAVPSKMRLYWYFQMMVKMMVMVVNTDHSGDHDPQVCDWDSIWSHLA